VTRRLDPKSELLERKALVLARFSMVEARAMCSHDVPDWDYDSQEEASHNENDRSFSTGREQKCPSCGSRDVVWLRPSESVGGRFVVTESAATALRLRCGVCGFAGDAVQYVMANFRISNPAFALDRIEHFLEDEKFLFGRAAAGNSAQMKCREQAGLPQKMAFKNTPRKARKRVIKNA